MRFQQNYIQRFKNYLLTKANASQQWFKQQSWKRLAWLFMGVPFIIGVLTVILLATLVWGGVFGELPDYAELNDIQNDQASEIYSDDDVLLGKYYIQNRTDASLDEISEELMQCLVATEDARFFEHGGIDVRAWARVLVKSIILRNESAGGGSTLSQQLAKNLYPRERYWLLSMPVNKLKEMFTARRLEQLYNKEELLSLYLNTVPFGDNAFGIKVAASRFFNKAPEHLKIEEAAVLIGMLKATTAYNPRKHPERSKQRRNVVLRQVANAGYLTDTIVDSLQTLPLTLDFTEEGHNKGSATYFRAHLRQEVLKILKDKKKPDGSAYNLYTDGLKIYTSIDSRLQRYAERAVNEQMPKVQANFHKDWRKRTAWTKSILEKSVERSDRYQHLKAKGLSQKKIEESFQDSIPMTVFDWRGGAVDTLMSPLDSVKHYLTLLNVGLLSVDPNTASIKAWVGGIDHRFLQYDHVKSKRPVGSTFKPIVYAAALQSGMMPCEYTESAQVMYEEYENWEPRNSDGKYEGAYSLAGALSGSVNTVAVKLALRAGISEVRALGQQMGIDSKIPKVPSIALGAVDASLMDMVKVYSTFANRGYKPDRLHYLDRIETKDGIVIYEQRRPNKSRFKKVLEPGHADMMIEIMKSVVDSGTAKRMRTNFGIRGQLMGKTGTTQDQGDGWFIGFNAKLVTGVWVGANQGGIHFRSLSRGQASRTALPICGAYLKRAYRNFSSIRKAQYETPPEMVMALLDCPPFLPELPLVGLGNGMEVIEWSQTIDAIDPDRLQEILDKTPRRNNESLSEYSRRIREQNERILRKRERREERDQKREERKDRWSRILFGKKNGGG